MKNIKLKIMGIALATAMIFGNVQVLASHCSEDDAIENPEANATTISVDQTVNVSLSSDDNDMDLYKFVPEISGIYTITINDFDLGVDDPNVFIVPDDYVSEVEYLYDAAIGEAYYDRENGELLTIRLSLTAGEVYYIIAWTEIPNYASEYSFVVSNTVSFGYYDEYGYRVYDYDRESADPAVSRWFPANIYWFDTTTVSQYIIPASDLQTLNGRELTGLQYYYTCPNSSSEELDFEAVDDGEVHIIDNEYSQYAFDGNGVLTTCPVNVYLKEVDSSEFSESFSEVGQSDVVYSGVLTLSDGIMKIEFDSPYVYNGGNLLVCIENPEEDTYASIEYYGQKVNYSSCICSFDGDWTTSDFIPTTTILFNMPDGWQEVGGQWKYYSNGAAVTGWKQLNNRWYFFNADGIMQTGWLKSPGNGKWYYLHPTDGYMMSSCWISSSGMWYYIGSDGLMVTGWQKIGNSWYYFNPIGGAMMKGWQKIGNNWYYLNPNGGAMVTGWQQISGSWYYMNSSGAMVTGWQKIGNTWYYFYSSGKMATGSVQIGSKTYQFASSGAWIPS